MPTQLQTAKTAGEFHSQEQSPPPCESTQCREQGWGAFLEGTLLELLKELQLERTGVGPTSLCSDLFPSPAMAGKAPALVLLPVGSPVQGEAGGHRDVQHCLVCGVAMASRSKKAKVCSGSSP